jgi:hypothetical protein
MSRGFGPLHRRLLVALADAGRDLRVSEIEIGGDRRKDTLRDSLAGLWAFGFVDHGDAPDSWRINDDGVAFLARADHSMSKKARRARPAAA